MIKSYFVRRGKGPSGGTCINGPHIMLFFSISNKIEAYKFLFYFQIGLVVASHSFFIQDSILIFSCFESDLRFYSIYFR